MIVVDPRNGGLDDDAIRAWRTQSRGPRGRRSIGSRGSPRCLASESSREDELVTKQILHGYTREDLTHDDPAGRRAREGAHVLDGRRHADRGAQPPRPLDLQPPAPAVRAGDEPRDGPSAGTVGDVARRAPGAAGAAPGRRAAARPRSRSSRASSGGSGRRARRLDATWRARSRRHRPARRAPAARLRGGGRRRRRRADPRGERSGGRTRSSTDPIGARRGRGERRAHPRGPADPVLDRRRGGRRARVASRGLPARGRRRGDPASARRRDGRRAGSTRRGDDDEAISSALARYREAIEDGIRKTLAKLGISCVDSYRGAEVVDVLGLDDEIARTCFVSTPTALGGLGLDDVAAAVLERHARAFGARRASLANPGYVKFRNGGEHHATEPAVVRAVHRIADPPLERLRTNASGAKGGAADEEMRAAHALNRAVEDAGATRAVREVRRDRARPPADRDPRPAGARPRERRPCRSTRSNRSSAILARFSTGAISHGSISAEAHETLALAMNAIGGRSNTGEGGEDPAQVPDREELQDQADRVGALRRDARVLRVRRGAPDQDRARVQTR